MIRSYSHWLWAILDGHKWSSLGSYARVTQKRCKSGQLVCLGYFGPYSFWDLWPEHCIRLYGECFRVVSHTLQIGIIKSEAYTFLLDWVDIPTNLCSFLQLNTVFPVFGRNQSFHELSNPLIFFVTWFEPLFGSGKLMTSRAGVPLLSGRRRLFCQRLWSDSDWSPWLAGTRTVLTA